MIDISVVIPVYNAEKFISNCIDSILCQKCSLKYEVIFVDDGSKDNSVSVIKNYQNPSFKIIEQQNAGPAVARNRGIEVSKGKYIAFIDSDDKWFDSFFEETFRFMESHNECVGVSVAQKHLTMRGNVEIPSCFRNYSAPMVIDDFFDFWSEWMHICTGSALMRTDVVKNVGGMRYDLRITEDLEFWTLLSTYGKWGFIPKILFEADGRDSVAPGKWIERMQVRWNNAPTILNWEQRIKQRLGDSYNTDSYYKALGQISRNLTYCHIMSNRESVGRQEAIKYGGSYPKDIWGRIMNLCKFSVVTWWIMCKVIQYREKHRR